MKSLIYTFKINPIKYSIIWISYKWTFCSSNVENVLLRNWGFIFLFFGFSLEATYGLKVNIKITKKCENSRDIIPALETLTVKAVIAESGEDAIDGLVHPLQAHGALWQLCEFHHW